MELSYSYLRTKEVINVADGRRLGKVCDVVFCYPENKIVGIVAPGYKSFFKKSEQLIEMRNIVKIGDDVILVSVNSSPKPPSRRGAPPVCAPVCAPSCPPPVSPPYETDRRSYDEYE